MLLGFQVLSGSFNPPSNNKQTNITMLVKKTYQLKICGNFGKIRFISQNVFGDLMIIKTLTYGKIYRNQICTKMHGKKKHEGELNFFFFFTWHLFLILPLHLINFVFFPHEIELNRDKCILFDFFILFNYILLFHHHFYFYYFLIINLLIFFMKTFFFLFL